MFKLTVLYQNDKPRRNGDGAPIHLQAVVRKVRAFRGIVRAEADPFLISNYFSFSHRPAPFVIICFTEQDPVVAIEAQQQETTAPANTNGGSYADRFANYMKTKDVNSILDAITGVL